MHLGGNRRWVPLEKAVFAGNRRRIIGIVTRFWETTHLPLP